jgi:hypothetical protein
MKIKIKCMKKLLPALFLVLLQQAKAQAPIVFCPPGAEWHYSFSAFWNSNRPNEEIKYIRDSVVDSETVKVLQHTRMFNYKNLAVGTMHTLIKQKGDTVFFRSYSTQHSWQILYNYAALAGQSWTTTICNFPQVTSTYTVAVDSVRTVMINNMSLRKLFVSYIPGLPLPSFVGNRTEITERIGCHKFLFNYIAPYYSTDADRSEGILCYEDASFGLKQFTEKECWYEVYVGISENNLNKGGISLYPNPSKGEFTIKMESGNTAQLVIFNALGQLVFKETMTIHETLLRPKLMGGVYYYQFLEGSQHSAVGKLIIE